MTDKVGAAIAGASAAEDEELSVPRASVNKMIRELAPNMRISNETRELIINCCNEFIHLIASESNEVCNGQSKKTIAPEHVLSALENLGFQSYLADVKECVDEAKEVALKKRRQSSKLQNLGIPEEELLRQQQELFAKAREEQAAKEQQEWASMQQQVNMANAFNQQQQQHTAMSFQPTTAAPPVSYPTPPVPLMPAQTSQPAAAATTAASAAVVATPAEVPANLVPSTVLDDDDDY